MQEDRENLNLDFGIWGRSICTQVQNVPQAAMSYQVHGRAPRRMWLNKQLRWRLSKVLYLCLHGLQGKESNCHNQYASTREVNTL